MKPSRIAATQAVFPTTCWTAVLSLKNAGSDKTRDQALGGLYEIYWFPLYAFARHMKDKFLHDTAKKRGGGIPTISLDTDQAEEWFIPEPSTSLLAISGLFALLMRRRSR